MGQQGTLARDTHRVLWVAAYEIINVAQSFWQWFSVRMASVALEAEARCPEGFHLLQLLGVGTLRSFERPSHMMETGAAVRTSGVRVRLHLPRLPTFEAGMSYEVVRSAHNFRRTRIGARACGAPQIHPSSFFPAAYHSERITADRNVRYGSKAVLAGHRLARRLGGQKRTSASFARAPHPRS